MTRIMYDSTSAADIPRGALMVAGYVDGLYAWSDADWALHSKATQVRITVGSGTLEADVADVERYDYTTDTGAAWAARKIKRDGYAGLYFSASLWPQVKASLEKYKVPLPQVQTWVADWNGSATVASGQMAHQYADSAMVGHHYDLSVAQDYWPGVDPPPVVTQPPPPSPGTAVPVAYGLLGDLLNNSLPDLINGLSIASGKFGDF